MVRIKPLDSYGTLILCLYDRQKYSPPKGKVYKLPLQNDKTIKIKHWF